MRIILLISLIAVFSFGWLFLEERQLQQSALLQREVLQNKLLLQQSELERLRQELEHHQELLTELRAEQASKNKHTSQLASAAPEKNTAQAAEESQHNPADPDVLSRRVEAKISRIEKFVQLNEGQKARLREKYSGEFQQNSQAAQKNVESLEEIIGRESAEFYLSQRSEAFNRAELRDIEKDVLYLSRKLELSPEQEDQMKNIMLAIEQEIRDGQSPNDPSDRQSRLKRMMEESRLRSRLQRSRFESLLSPQQFELYLADQSQSPEADMEVWHGAAE